MQDYSLPEYDPDRVARYVRSEAGIQREILDIIQLLKETHERHPYDPEVAYLLAVHCSKGFAHEDNDELAEEAFEQAIEIDPQNYEYFSEFCRFLVKQGRYLDVETLYLDWFDACEPESYEEALGYRDMAYFYLDLAQKAAERGDREERDYMAACSRASAYEAYKIAPHDESIFNINEKAERVSGRLFSEDDSTVLQSRFNALFAMEEEDNPSESLDPSIP